MSLPGVVFRETLLSFRNWSRKDIWEEGRSPSTEEETELELDKIFIVLDYWEVSALCTGQIRG